MPFQKLPFLGNIKSFLSKPQLYVNSTTIQRKFDTKMTLQITPPHHPPPRSPQPPLPGGRPSTSSPFSPATARPSGRRRLHPRGAMPASAPQPPHHWARPDSKPAPARGYRRENGACQRPSSGARVPQSFFPNESEQNVVYTFIAFEKDQRHDIKS